MKIHFKNNRNQKIVGVLSVPNKKSREISIIIHGFCSSKNHGGKITAEILEKNNINSLAIDLDDIGESEPHFEDMTITKHVETALSTIDYCKDKGFKKINLIGTSSGGSIAMAVVLKYPKINSLILRSASPSDAEWYKNYVAHRKGLTDWKKKGYMEYITKDQKIKKIKYTYYTDALKYDMYKRAKDITVPTLMLHGSADTIVPLKYAIKLAKNFPKAKFVIIKGADHGLGVNGDYTRSQQEIIKWLTREKK